MQNIGFGSVSSLRYPIRRKWPDRSRYRSWVSDRCIPKIYTYVCVYLYIHNKYTQYYTRADPKYHFLSFEASVVINTEYLKRRRDIFLSNISRNLCASVCLFAFLLCGEPFIQSTSRVAGVLQRTQGSAVSHFGAIWTRDTFRINKLLIKYRTAQAGSGAPHAGRA